MLGNLVLNKLALPWTEAERLDALESYGILDTPPEPAFDDIAKLAALTCDAPIALVSLVGKERQWFKSELGIGMQRDAAQHVDLRHRAARKGDAGHPRSHARSALQG